MTSTSPLLTRKKKATSSRRWSKPSSQTDKTLSQKYDDVWLWSEYPDRRGRPDTGIDLVARDRNTAKLTAVQCKFYDPRSTIYERNVTSFIATVAGEAEWGDGVIVAPTDRWSENLEARLQRQTKSILRWTGATLQESSVDWSRFDLNRPEQIDNLAVKELREHQEQAHQDVINGFNAGNDRGKLIMACGTGKTLTGQRIAEYFYTPPPKK